MSSELTKQACAVSFSRVVNLQTNQPHKGDTPQAFVLVSLPYGVFVVLVLSHHSCVFNGVYGVRCCDCHIYHHRVHHPTHHRVYCGVHFQFDDF